MVTPKRKSNPEVLAAKAALENAGFRRPKVRRVREWLIVEVESGKPSIVDRALGVVQAATGRRGDYDGRITVTGPNGMVGPDA